MAPVVPHLGHFLFLKLTKASAYTTAAISMHSNNASTSMFVRMLIALSPSSLGNRALRILRMRLEDPEGCFLVRKYTRTDTVTLT